MMMMIDVWWWECSGLRGAGAEVGVVWSMCQRVKAYPPETGFLSKQGQ